MRRPWPQANGRKAGIPVDAILRCRPSRGLSLRSIRGWWRYFRFSTGKPVAHCKDLFITRSTRRVKSMLISSLRSIAYASDDSQDVITGSPAVDLADVVADQKALLTDLLNDVQDE